MPSSITKAAVGGLALLAGGMLWRHAKRQSCRYVFHNKVVLITGGSRGLGLVLARRLARQGARLAICSRTQSQVQQAENELSALGTEVFAAVCDVSDPQATTEFVRQVGQKYGHIDIVVNCAGIIQAGPQPSMTLADFQCAMASNFYGALHMIQAALPGMRQRRMGRIVNIASIGGLVSVPHLLPYSASKFALVGLSEGLRSALRQDGILVTTVSPGLMRTGSARNAFFKGNHRAEYAWFALSSALPMVTVSAENAADQILEACRQGDAALTISLPAKAAQLLHGLAPGLVADLFGLANRLLPTADSEQTGQWRGYESESPLAPSLLTTLGDQAAARNNELLPAAGPAGNSS